MGMEAVSEKKACRSGGSMSDKRLQGAVPDYVINEDWAVHFNASSWVLYERTKNQRPSRYYPSKFYPSLERLLKDFLWRLNKEKADPDLIQHIQDCSKAATQAQELLLHQLTSYGGGV